MYLENEHLRFLANTHFTVPLFVFLSRLPICHLLLCWKKHLNLEIDVLPSKVFQSFDSPSEEAVKVDFRCGPLWTPPPVSLVTLEM